MKWYERPQVLEIIVFLTMFASISLATGQWLTSRPYPLVPLLPSQLIVPPPFDAFLIISLVSIGVVSLLLPKDPRPLFGLLINLGLLLWLDQSRWQLWAFISVFFLIGFYLIRRHPNEARVASIYNIFRLILMSGYIWSALQQFNVSFLTEVMPRLIASIPFVGQALSTSLPIMFIVPIMELVIGIGLYNIKTRKPAVILAMALHVFILLALHPWGAPWDAVAWPWHIGMILLLFSLFWRASEAIDIQTLMKSKHPFILAVVLFFFLLPGLSFFGLWDSTLSFARSSGNEKYADLIMRPEHLKVLPETVWKYAERQRDGSVKLPLSAWSMASLHVPPYPEDRVFLSALAWVCEKTGDKIDMEIYEKPQWITKDRAITKRNCGDIQ